MRRGAGDRDPRGEAAVIKHFQDRMLSGLFVPEVPSE